MPRFCRNSMASRARITIGLIFFLLAFASHAATQVTPPIMEEQHEQQRRIDEEIQRRLKERPSPTAPKIESELPVIFPEGQCQIIKQVFLYGADHFAERKRKKVYAPYLNQCLDNNGISKLVRSVQEWYLQAGYITTRVNLKQRQSSLDQGNLELWVIEGRIGRFILGANAAFDESRIKSAFPVARGDVLNIHDLDQGIEQLNRLFSQSFRMQIRPSKQPGFSDIFLVESNNSNTLLQPMQPDPKLGRRQISYQYNNGGIETTGLHLHNLGFKRDNMFGVNDVISFNWQRGSPYLQKRKESELIKFDASLPNGYWLYKLSYYNSRTDRTVPGSPSQFQSRGDTVTTKLSANKVIYRDKKNKLEGFGNFEISDRRNYINDTLVQVSSRLISSVDVGLIYTRYNSQSTIVISPTLSQGVPWFGAIGDTASIAVSDPHAEYTKLGLYAFYRQPISITKTKKITYESTL
ncbi:MAG: ShlB/FhaC/HecB family hemolysin secretion/activation protein, partial [Acidiferrobacterales bacterium]